MQRANGIKLAANAVSGRLPALLKQNSGLRAFLLYGNDESRLQACHMDVVAAIKSATAAETKDFTAAQIKDGTIFLQDELGSVSLLGGTDIIRVSDVDDKMLGYVESLSLKNSPHYLILLAESLTKTSPLRKWAEANPNFVSIGCYAEEGANLTQAIAGEFRARGAAFDTDALNALAEALSGDLMLLKQEVEKLILYKGDDRSPINRDDVSASIAGHIDEDSESLFFALLNRDSAAAMRSLERLESQNNPAIQIIRFLLLQWLRLLLPAYSIEFDGLAPGDALEKVRPPFFFKQIPVLRRALPHWKVRDIRNEISLLLALEKDVKLNAHQHYALLGQRLAARMEYDSTHINLLAAAGSTS